MPKDSGQPAPELVEPDPKEVEAALEQIANLHPQLGGGNLQSRDGSEYAPANVDDGAYAKNFFRNTRSQPTAAPETPAEPEADRDDPLPTGGAAQPDRLFANKYKSAEELEKGYQNVFDELQRRNAENAALKAVNQHVELLQEGFRRERPEPVAPQFIRARVNDQGEVDVPLADLDAIIARRANEVAQQRVDEILTPITNLGKANARVRSEYPEFAKVETEFSNWLQVNPEYAKRVANDPDFALEASFLKFRESTGKTTRQTATEVTRQAQETIDHAKRNAGAIAGSPVPAGRRITQDQARTARMTKLVKYAEETGDRKPLVKARLSEAVGEDYLNSLMDTSWGK